MKKTFIVIVSLIFSFYLLAQKKINIKKDSLREITEIKKVDNVSAKKVLYGTASYYNDKFNGRRTANGEIFSQSKMTCACNRLPLGTKVRVTNVKNGKSIIVKVNDRLAPHMTRVVDLSRAGAQQLGFINAGLCKVKVEVL